MLILCINQLYMHYTINQKSYNMTDLIDMIIENKGLKYI